VARQVLARIKVMTSGHGPIYPAYFRAQFAAVPTHRGRVDRDVCGVQSNCKNHDLIEAL
jgi:hypothetical protein